MTAADDEEDEVMGAGAVISTSLLAGITMITMKIQTTLAQTRKKCRT
jgi:hypothetical protein